MILEVQHLDDLGTHECNLPSFVLHSHKASERIIVVHEQDDSFCALSWTGRTSSSNRIELSSKNSHFKGSSSITFELVVVHDADEILVVPSTAYDWEVISTQAEQLESFFLQQHNVVCLDKAIVVNLSPSMRATMKIQSIKCGKATLGAGYARLSSRTVVVVEPVTTKQQSIRQKSIGRSEFVFRVVPLWIGILVPPHARPEQLTHGFNSDDFVEWEDIEIDGDTKHNIDGVTCFINTVDAIDFSPLQHDEHENESIFLALVKAPRMENAEAKSPQGAGGFGPETLAPEKWYRGFDKGVVVRVVGLGSILPGHIFLPLSIRKSLCVDDYNHVTLLPLLDHGLDEMSVRPAGVILHPVRWGSVAVPVPEQLKRTEEAAAGNEVLWGVEAQGKRGPGHAASSPTKGRSELRLELAAALLRFSNQQQSGQRQGQRQDQRQNGLCSPCRSLSWALSSGLILSLTFPHDKAAAILCHQPLSEPQYGSCNTRTMPSGDQIHPRRRECVSVDFLVEINGRARSERRRRKHEDEQQQDANVPLFALVDDGETMASVLEVVKIGAPCEVPHPNPGGVDEVERGAGLTATDPRPWHPFAMMANLHRQLLCDAMLTLGQSMACERVLAGARPSLGSLLVGARGAGKSSLAQAVAARLEASPAVVANVERINCLSLRGKALTVVMDHFSEVFARAQSLSPSLICIDDLDVVAPAARTTTGSENPDSVRGLGASEAQTLLLVAHIRCLFANAWGTLQRSHDCAAASLNMNSREEIGFVATANAVFVLATAAAATAVHPQLLAPQGGLGDHSEIPRLGPRARLDLLVEGLARVGAELLTKTGPRLAVGPDADADAVIAAEEVIINATEGWCVNNFVALSKKVLAVAARDEANKAVKLSTIPTHNTVLVTHATLLQAIADFGPVSAGGSPMTAPAVTWSDVGGTTAAKREIMDTLVTPKLFSRVFASSPSRPPKAMLLFGPPGCGKTHLASACADVSQMDLFAVRGPELLDKYIGASERAVRALFDRAQRLGRDCIIFFDEFEALAPRRGRDNTGVTDRVVNQLLTLLDGAEDILNSACPDDNGEANADGLDQQSEEWTCNKSGGGGGDRGGSQIYIIAASSRPDLIDPALLRPGRIEQHVYLGLPNPADRVQIMEALLRKLIVPDEQTAVKGSLEEIAAHPKASMMTAADFKAIVNSAHLLAAKQYLHVSMNIDRYASARLWRNADGEEVRLAVKPHHLLAAFYDLRPSLSHESLDFYADICRRYQKAGKHNAAADVQKFALM